MTWGQQGGLKGEDNQQGGLNDKDNDNNQIIKCLTFLESQAQVHFNDDNEEEEHKNEEEEDHKDHN